MSTHISLIESADALREGQVGVMPTDTVMGLVAPAHNKEAVNRLFRIKKREQKPGTILSDSVDDLVQLGLRKRYLQAVAQYWPNPISVVIPCASTDLAYLHQGKQSLAVRIPSDTALRAVLQQTGPLVTTSANLPGQPPAKTTTEAQRYFGKEVDFYVQQEVPIEREASTVIQVLDDTIEVLRQGAVILDEETGAIHDVK